MAGKDSGKDLTDLPGVGAATAKKLKDAGLTTVAKIRKAGRDGLTAAGISTPTAARILKGVAQEAGTKAKEAGTKAKEAAKKATTKASSAAAKTAKKATKAATKAVVKQSVKKVVKTAGRTDRKVLSAKEEGRKGKTLKTPSLQDILKSRKK
ncbi:MAG: helix-hairpin-helix domain-containing protein [Candidatus Poseidoniaceae archaeon]|jgi:hypothetical protein